MLNRSSATGNVPRDGPVITRSLGFIVFIPHLLVTEFTWRYTDSAKSGIVVSPWPHHNYVTFQYFAHESPRPSGLERRVLLSASYPQDKNLGKQREQLR